MHCFSFGSLKSDIKYKDHKLILKQQIAHYKFIENQREKSYNSGKK